MFEKFLQRILIFSLFPSLPAYAVTDVALKGTLYKLNTDRKVKLYTWQMTVCGNLWTSKYFNLDGSLAVEDRTEYQEGRLVKYGYHRTRIDERSSVTVNANKIEFTTLWKGVTKVKTKTTDGVFLTGPAVFSFIETHLKELREGKEFEFKYGVLDIREYFSFKLSMEGPRVKISAVNPFVRLAISPIYVTLSPTGSFRGITGRSILMETDGRKMIPIDADLVVESETSIICP